MAGLILTAKAFDKQLQKDTDKFLKERMHATGITDTETLLKWSTEYRAARLEVIKKDFERQCKIAVALREVAEATGLIRKPERNETPRLEDSPALPERYALITIRPEPGTCLVYFEKAVKEFMERPWVLGAEYHFEQTGQDEATMGDGFHVHIVAKCKKSIRATEIIAHAARDFECKHTIQIGNQRNKFLKTERDLEYALNYIRGDKHDEEKEDAVALNELWRKTCGLNDVYTTRDWDNRESSTNAVIIEEVF